MHCHVLYLSAGQYYCETCYVEIFGKKCSHCAQVILGSGLKFSSENYHRECFKCWQCGAGLSQGANTIKGRPVCGGCYDQHFLHSCTVCHQTVAEGIIFKEQRFHPQCFKCLRCGLLLEDKKGEFLLTEDGLQCKKCVASNMSVLSSTNIYIMTSTSQHCRSGELQEDSVTEQCSSCQLPIHVKDHVSDGEQSWHYKCFVCQQCKDSLVGTKYYDKQGSLYCDNCFHAEHLPTCYHCKVELKGKGEWKGWDGARGRAWVLIMSCRRSQDEL